MKIYHMSCKKNLVLTYRAAEDNAVAVAVHHPPHLVAIARGRGPRGHPKLPLGLPPQLRLLTGVELQHLRLRMGVYITSFGLLGWSKYHIYHSMHTNNNKGLLIICQNNDFHGSMNPGLLICTSVTRP